VAKCRILLFGGLLSSLLSASPIFPHFALILLLLLFRLLLLLLLLFIFYYIIMLSFSLLLLLLLFLWGCVVNPKGAHAHHQHRHYHRHHHHRHHESPTSGSFQKGVSSTATKEKTVEQRRTERKSKELCNCGDSQWSIVSAELEREGLGGPEAVQRPCCNWRRLLLGNRAETISIASQLQRPV
jgi:hypothetical protein